MTRAFKNPREAAECYKGWKEEEIPGFHEVRALSLHLYKKAGKDGWKFAGHASEGMTKNYQRDHEEVVWSEVILDLNISEITGWFCASFAQDNRGAKALSTKLIGKLGENPEHSSSRMGLRITMLVR